MLRNSTHCKEVNKGPLLNLSEASMRVSQPVLGSVSLLIMLTVTAMALRLNAQVETGQIAGTVMDQTGAAVPNAAVTIKDLSTNTVRSTVSSESGAYVVPGLEPAIYQVRLSPAASNPLLPRPK
jgi:hypothetical protein